MCAQNITALETQPLDQLLPGVRLRLGGVVVDLLEGGGDAVLVPHDVIILLQDELQPAGQVRVHVQPGCVQHGGSWP